MQMAGTDDLEVAITEHWTACPPCARRAAELNPPIFGRPLPRMLVASPSRELRHRCRRRLRCYKPSLQSCPSEGPTGEGCREYRIAR